MISILMNSRALKVWAREICTKDLEAFLCRLGRRNSGDDRRDEIARRQSATIALAPPGASAKVEDSDLVRYWNMLDPG